MDDVIETIGCDFGTCRTCYEPEDAKQDKLSDIHPLCYCYDPFAGFM